MYKITSNKFNACTGREEIEAIADSATDLDSVGTHWSPGSVVIIADSGAPAYMLNASGQWKEI